METIGDTHTKFIAIATAAAAKQSFNAPEDNGKYCAFWAAYKPINCALANAQQTVVGRNTYKIY
jgi:hypothetical protein